MDASKIFKLFDAGTISFLLTKGARVLNIDHEGYHFDVRDFHFVHEYRAGGICEAKAIMAASAEVFRVIKTVRAQTRHVRAVLTNAAAQAVLNGATAPTSRTASL